MTFLTQNIKSKSKNIGSSDLVISDPGLRKLVMGGNLSTDIFAIRDSADTISLFDVNGKGWATFSPESLSTGDNDLISIIPRGSGSSRGYGINFSGGLGSSNTYSYIRVNGTELHSNKDGDRGIFAKLSSTNSGAVFKGQLGTYTGIDYHYSSTGAVSPYHIILTAGSASRLATRFWAWSSKVDSLPADPRNINTGSLNEHMRLQVDGGNLGLGVSTWGTSAEKTFAIGTGVAPTTSPTDAIQFYSADIVAGNAAPHFRTEDGSIIKLYQETTAITGATIVTGTGTNVHQDTTFDGYTMAKVVAALRAQGLLQ